MIKNIVFDIGGVLLEFSQTSWLKNLGYSDEISTKFWKMSHDCEYTEKYMIGECTHKEYVDFLCKKYPNYKNEFKKFNSAKVRPIMLPPIKQTMEFAHQLKQRGYNIYILSDMERPVISYFKKTFPYYKELDGKIFSGYVGHRKPEPEIYQILLKRYKLNPKDTVFIDDVQKNLDGAKNVGINTILATTPNEIIKNVNILLEKR